MKNLSHRFIRRFQAVTLLVVSGLFGLASEASATISIQLSAGELKTTDGSAMPLTGLLLLVASTQDDQFGQPTENAFVSGDDVVVYRKDLRNLQRPGQFNDFIAGLVLSGAWGPGDRLGLYWYPTLTVDATQPGPGVPYGFFTAEPGQERDGSDPWVTPGDGATISLYFHNKDADMPPIVKGGAYPASSGLASWKTPEGNADPVDPGQPEDPQNPEDPEDPGEPSKDGSWGPLRALVAVGSGVSYSEWLGYVFTFNNGWLYHYELGFVYLFGSDEGSLWFWDDASQEFWWTSAKVYPFVYRHADGTWYYFNGVEDDGKRYFYKTSNPQSPWVVF